MLRPALALAFAVTVAACDKSDQATEQSSGPQMTAEAISANDITAIDAVTGEAANMAEDVQIDANLTADGNATGNSAAPARRASSAPARRASPAAEPAPASTTPAPAPAENAQ